MKPYGTILLCLVIAAGAAAACCTETTDGNLPTAVSFTDEPVHIGDASDELAVRYYPNSTVPSDYTVTFEIWEGGAIQEAVAGRVYENISAEHPIEIKPAIAGTAGAVTVDTVIYDCWGRTVHTSVVNLTPDAAET